MITRKQLVKISTLFVVWRTSLFLLGMIADVFLKYQPTFPYADIILIQSHVPRWLYSWANFDGVHYLTIGEHGYVGTGLIQAFFPFFPYVLLHMPYVLFGGHVNLFTLGMILNTVAAFCLFVTWFGFVKHFFNEKIAWSALFVLLLFPTSFFFGAFYTESLFLLFTLLSFLAAEKKNWVLVSIFIFLAMLTRLVGVFLIPALLIELWYSAQQEKKKTKGKKLSFLQDVYLFLVHQRIKVLLLCVSSVGLLVYMAFLTKEFHDPLYFLHVQSAFGAGRVSQTLISYPQVVWRSYKILRTSRPFDLTYLTFIQEFLVGTFGFLLVLLSMKYVKLSQSAFAIAAFLLPTVTGTFSSMPRYILVCFPLFIVIAHLIQKKPIFAVLWISVSTVLLVVNTVMFLQGVWVS